MLTDLTSTSKNKFVHLALQHTFSLAVEIKGLAAIQKTLANGIDIIIVGDNDFYSQRAKVSSCLFEISYLIGH